MDSVLVDALRAVPANWWLVGAAMTAALGGAYYILFKPMDWTKELWDVGFDASERRLWRAGREGRIAAMVNAQRKRQVGGLPPAFPNGWYSVLESSRLARGAVRHVAVLGLNLAVFRTESGAVRVLDAYCPHMGANMAVGGTVRGECLECPFHEWRFDGRDGKCVVVPYAEKVPDFAKARCWECMDMNGFVFVWYHVEGESPSWWPQPVAPVADGSWSFAGRNEFLVSCHIQEIPENGADVAHLNAVHRPGIGTPSLSRHVWSARWAAGEGDRKHTALLQLHHHVELLGMSLLKMDVEAHQIGPGYVELFMQTQFGPMVIVQSVTPEEPLLQRVIHRAYCPRLLVPYAKIVLFGESVMFERDIKVWNHKTFAEKPMLVKEDALIARYRRWYGQFYSKNRQKKAFQKDSMDW